MSSITKDLTQLLSFLPCKTSDKWIVEALKQKKMVLNNHAYLEKCAARSAVTLMFRYADKPDLQQKMSRLAREELVHFEQVTRLMKKRGIEYTPHKPSRYVGMLSKDIRQKEPHRLIDTLIVGAFIEARSCERFSALAPHLDDELQKFYTGLLHSESRHFMDYITLAEQYSPEPIDERIAHFSELERQAIATEDKLFRFHSGIPSADVAI